MTAEYVPDSGDLVWINLDPRIDHGRGGQRPFLVLSKRSYNAKTSLMVGVPIAAKRTGYPFAVELPGSGPITGAAMADQVRCVDWRLRTAEHVHEADIETVRNVRRLLATLLELR